jgi:hypothetical protein
MENDAGAPVLVLYRLLLLHLTECRVFAPPCGAAGTLEAARGAQAFG